MSPKIVWPTSTTDQLALLRAVLKRRARYGRKKRQRLAKKVVTKP